MPGLDFVESSNEPDPDARYVKRREAKRPEMCPECFSVDTMYCGNHRECLKCGTLYE